jgi:hypothetical protein
MLDELLANCWRVAYYLYDWFVLSKDILEVEKALKFQMKGCRSWGIKEGLLNPRIEFGGGIDYLRSEIHGVKLIGAHNVTFVTLWLNKVNV